MQHLDGSGTPVPFIGRRFLKVNKNVGSFVWNYCSSTLAKTCRYGTQCSTGSLAKQTDRHLIAL